jgi:flagellar assembly factor FliW
MIVGTTRFGQVEVDDKSIIRLPRGLIGFDDASEYFLLDHGPESAFRWLQSVARPELAFVVVDPSEFFSDYEFELTETEADYLGIKKPGDAMVITLVTIDQGAGQVTTNLVGPIVINSNTLTGMQIVIDDERFGTKHILARGTNAVGTRSAARAA